MTDRRLHASFNAHAVGTQIMGEVFGGHMQRVQQVSSGRDILFPPPAIDGPSAIFEAGVQAGDEAVFVEDGKDVVAPAALMDGFVDLPQVVEVEELEDPFAVPEDAVEGTEEDWAWLRQRCIQEW